MDLISRAWTNLAPPGAMRHRLTWRPPPVSDEQRPLSMMFLRMTYFGPIASF
jgi:hypothetical protein